MHLSNILCILNFIALQMSQIERFIFVRNFMKLNYCKLLIV